jgi:pimeloyl-ACP methyl ester carboxylesterase
MSSENEREVELSHGRTRYIDAGSGPPVLLLHGVGFTSGGDSWWPVVGPLSTRLRVLAPDFLGWGWGDRFDREYSFAYLVDFVREFQDALGLSRTHVVGHSMGGWIATLLAYESPQRIDKLVLLAAGGAATRTLASMTAFSPPSREQIETQLHNTVKVPEADFAALTERAVRKTQVPGAVEAYQKILNHMNDPEHRRRYNTLRRLSHITTPTLIVWGRDDKVNALEMGELLHAGINGSRLEVLEDCGHFVPTEKPDELSRVLLDFLTA